MTSLEMAYSHFPEETVGGTNNLTTAPKSEMGASQTRKSSDANL